MELNFYKVTSILGFTSMITVVYEKTIMVWVFNTVPKRPPVHIIRLTLTTVKNGQSPCKRVRVDEYGNLENSTDVTNLLVD